MSKHTNGEWEAFEKDCMFGVRVKGGYPIVEQVFAVDSMDSDGEWDIVDEQEANANLLAASSEMLKLLKELEIQDCCSKCREMSYLKDGVWFIDHKKDCPYHKDNWLGKLLAEVE